MISIRAAQVEDAAFLRAMVWEAILASPGFVAHMSMEMVQQLEDKYWTTWLEYPDPAFIAQDENLRKLGAVLLKPNDPMGWRLVIGLEGDARGQGVGKQLVMNAIEFARADGKAYINLVVDPANTRAIHLYENVGFMVTGTQPNGLTEMRILFAQ
jgi:ribosomal protein S18 acetylase RimI-like enzyme